MTTRDFRDIQFAFAAHLRDPLANPPPAGIEERRLVIYRELFFNNVVNFLSNFFPVLRGLYSDDDWQAMARDFYARHRAHTPYFLEIAEEFLHYLAEERTPQPCDPPFAQELAHYEWLELVLDVATEEIPVEGFDPVGDLLDGVPLLTPVAVLASYRWPVHQISANRMLAERVPTAPLATPVFFVVYRDRADAVRFLEVNATTARLFSLLREQPMLSGRDVALCVARELGHPDPSVVVSGAADLLQMLRERDIVLGTRLP